MISDFLKNKLVLFHIVLAVIIGLAIWFEGWNYYNIVNLQNSVSNSNFTLILVGVISVDVLFNFWRISVVNMKTPSVEKVKEKVPTLEEENLENLQKRMKENNESENMVNEKPETKIENKICAPLENPWSHQDIQIENEKEPEIIPPPQKYNKDEILNWLIENPGCNLNDFKAMKEEQKLIAEEQQRLLEEKKKRDTEERTQNVLKEAAGQITTSDIKQVKDAIVAYWVNQISSGNISVKPSKETLKNMGLEEDSWSHDTEEKTTKSIINKKKDEPKQNFT